MQYMPEEKTYNTSLLENLRAKVTQLGRWHLKRRKADSTRLWKLLFRDIEGILDEKYPFSERTSIKLMVYTRQNKYFLIVHKHNITRYHGYVAKGEENYEKIIADIISVLSHYNLTLSETAESKQNSRSLQKQYEVKFAENN